MNRTLTWSYGGGTQSIAIAILVGEGKLPRPEYIGIADTSREKSSTWKYHEEVIKPYLEGIGLEVDIIPHKPYAYVDLYSYQGKILMPMFTSTGMMRTYCSSEWKKNVLRRRIRELGYGPKNPVTTWIGMSKDEFKRMKPSGVKWMEYTYPLIYEYPLERDECRQLVIDRGFPTPPKSSCWMCPHMSDAEWLEMRQEHPGDFENAIKIEEELQKKEEVYLFWAGVSLKEVADIPDNKWFDMVSSLRKRSSSKMEGQLSFDDFCDSGFCFV